MFHLATLKLTAWYVAILMIISIIFSFAIYQITSTEVNRRLMHFQSNIQNEMPTSSPIIYVSPPTNNLRTVEQNEAAANIAAKLVYANILVLIVGGVGGYFLARRTLRPIEKAHDAQSRFTSDASHELRTPLAVMKAELEVALRDSNSSKEEYREILESNLEEVQKLTSLSEMLLNISRLEHDKLVRKALDLGEVTKTSIKRFNLEKSRYQLKTPKALMVHANEPALTELTSILIDNALKYSPEDSLVSIRVYKRQNVGVFEITNTGAGIPPEKMPFIFDRFFRADDSRTGGDKKGYGLGLAIAKKIVELHGGELSVTSEIDHRTTFVFTLPLSKNTQAKNQK